MTDTANRLIVNLETLIRLFSKVVTDAGYDHVAAPNSNSSGCRYVGFDGGRLVSICIVGRAFDYLGILRATVLSSTGVFDTQGQQYSACTLGEPLWERAFSMGVEFTEDAQLFAREVQSLQDGGESWGNALTMAVAGVHNGIISDAEATVAGAEADKDAALAALPKPAPEFASEPAW